MLFLERSFVRAAALDSASVPQECLLSSYGGWGGCLTRGGGGVAIARHGGYCIPLLEKKSASHIQRLLHPKAAWGRACLFAGGATPAYKKSIHNKLMLNQLLELGYLLLLALDNREKFFLLRLQFLLKRSNLFVFCL